MGDIEAYIRTNSDDLEQLAAGLVSDDTQNPPGNTEPAADRIQARLESYGLEVERLTYAAGKPNLLVRIEGRQDERLLLNGHLDTVPYDPDRWQHDPLGEWDGDRLYGRGAADMKGALSAMVFLAEAYAATDTQPAVGLELVIVSDEETMDTAGLAALLEDDRIDGDACIIGEKTSVEGRPAITAADRGSIWLDLVAAGAAAHGSRPVFGENAIWRLVAAVEHLESGMDEHRLDLPEELTEILQDTVALYDDPAIEGLLTHPSVNLGRLNGGEAINSVPEHAHAEIDIRMTAGVDGRGVLDRIREIIDQHEGVMINDCSMSDGTLTSPDEPVVEAMRSASDAVTGQETRIVTATGGGDAKDLRRAGIPTIEFGLASDTVHDVEEYITREQLLQDALAYHAAVERYGELVDGA